MAGIDKKELLEWSLSIMKEEIAVALTTLELSKHKWKNVVRIKWC